MSVWPLSLGGDHRCEPRLKHHAKAIFRVQGHHDLRLDASLGQQQIIAAADKRHEQRPFDRREMEAHAGARPGTKRQLGIAGPWAFTAQPPFRPKLFGVGPKVWMSVQIVDTDQDERALRQ